LFKRKLERKQKAEISTTKKRISKRSALWGGKVKPEYKQNHLRTAKKGTSL